MPDPAPRGDLETLLRAVAARVELPPAPSLAPAVGARLRADSARSHRPPFPGAALWSRRKVLLAIALAVALLGGAAVAGRLAIGAVGIEVVPSLAPSARPEAPKGFGPRVPVARARAEVGFTLAWPPSLGRPDDAYVVHPGGGAGAVLAWREAAGYTRIAHTPWSVVLFELPGPVEVATKTALPESIHRARVNGRPAFWITGPHDLTLQGAFGGETVRVSGNVLLWQRLPDVTCRLESTLSKRASIALAESIS
jgi:hypothetical protein